MTAVSLAVADRAPLVRLPDEIYTLSLMGVRVKLLISSADTDGTWSLLDYTVPPLFHGPLPHRHARTTETFQVLEGTLTVRVDGRAFEVPAGGFALIPPGLVHQFSNDTPGPVRFLAHLHPGGMEDYFRELSDVVARERTWPPADPSRLLELMRRHDSFPGV
jgi:mannose-6-phosphate isomerase-like protein (cupin superfamily)